MIPNAREEFKNILIISGEDYSEGIVAGYWSAHHGDPILYVQRNRIPYCTLEAIRKLNDINIYIIGSTKTVSKAVKGYTEDISYDAQVIIEDILSIDHEMMEMDHEDTMQYSDNIHTI